MESSSLDTILSCISRFSYRVLVRDTYGLYEIRLLKEALEILLEAVKKKEEENETLQNP